MYSPRRFRRRLLLPPGWVALGFLLLLGCLVLRAQWRRLRPANVVQLTMPPLQADRMQLRLFRQDSARQVTIGIWDSYNPYFDLKDKRATAKIEQLRPWQTFYLKGERRTDSLNIPAIRKAVQTIQADTGHARGVRVRLAKAVSYSSLVALLDMMSQLNQKRYWLDIQHTPITFYVITPRPLTLMQRRNYAVIDCQGLGSDVYLVKVTPLTFKQLVRQLQQPVWQPLVALVGSMLGLLLAVSSGWRWALPRGAW